MSWEKDVEGIEERKALAKKQGGEASIARHHNLGKLTVRERIDAFLDDDSFREHGKMAGGAHLDEGGNIASFSPANYVVGVGTANGQRVAFGGEDFTFRGGSPNAAGLRKSIYAEHLALQYRIPLVRMLEGGGGSVESGEQDPRKPRTVGDPGYEPPRFQIVAEAYAAVPIASAALGPVAGFPAGRMIASHFSVMSRTTSQVMIAGPALVERALGKTLSKQELGGPDVHATSGVIDNIAEDEHGTFEQIRQFLSYLPSSVWELAPRLRCTDPVERREQALLDIVPRNRRRAFNIKKVIKLIVDKGSFFEIAPTYGKRLCIGLARINRQSVGITANDCRHLAGAMDAQAGQKMTRLIELCDNFHLPVVNFVDEPGFMIGPGAEADGTIKYGMQAVLAASSAQTPWASILVHKNFGVASLAHFGPDNYLIDWPSAERGALPIEGGVAVAYRRKIAEAPDPDALRKELEEKLASARSPYRAAESFAVHELIDPRETRPVLCDWIEWIQPRLQSLKGPVTFKLRP